MSAPKKNPQISLANFVKRLVKSVWLFPAVMTVLLLLLTAFQINGSSIGAYNELLYGGKKDPNLLLNHPELVRSDEWLVTTQLTIAQHAAGYPRVNHNIDAGRDMSVVGDSPYKDWSSIFKPQNLVFLVLPLAFAFAFKWWLLLYLTIISCYFVVLRFFPTKRLFASLFATSIGLSPFFFWWYATGVMAPVFYGFFIILLGLRIINNERLAILGRRLARYSQLIYALVLGYLLACFALILYPPLQVPVALAVAALLAGAYLQQYGLSKALFGKESLQKIGVFATGVVLALLVILAFVHTRSDVINTIKHSAYPGARSFSAGGYPVHELFSAYLQPQLQRISRAANYYANQSEASQFILFLPFLFLPGWLLIFAERKLLNRINWPLIMIQLCIMLYFFDLFVPDIQLLYRITLLNQVQHARLFIGLGFLGVLQLLLVAKSIEKLKIRQRTIDFTAGSYSLICLAALVWSGQYTRAHYPKFISSELLIGFLALFFVSIMFCFISRRLLIGASLFLVFSIGSVVHIHPLYHGLGPIYNSALSREIDRVSKPGDAWVSLDNLTYENIPLISNRDSISGIKPYPDLAFWSQVEGLGPGNKNEYIYNRYAHVLFSTDKTMHGDFYLHGPDSFVVKFDCYPFIEKHVQFAMATHALNNYSCVKKIAEVHYPAVTFYLYKIN